MRCILIARVVSVCAAHCSVCSVGGECDVGKCVTSYMYSTTTKDCVGDYVYVHLIATCPIRIVTFLLVQLLILLSTYGHNDIQKGMHVRTQTRACPVTQLKNKHWSSVVTCLDISAVIRIVSEIAQQAKSQLFLLITKGMTGTGDRG